MVSVQGQGNRLKTHSWEGDFEQSFWFQVLMFLYCLPKGIKGGTKYKKPGVGRYTGGMVGKDGPQRGGLGG